MLSSSGGCLFRFTSITHGDKVERDSCSGTTAFKALKAVSKTSLIAISQHNLVFRGSCGSCCGLVYYLSLSWGRKCAITDISVDVNTWQVPEWCIKNSQKIECGTLKVDAVSRCRLQLQQRAFSSHKDRGVIERIRKIGQILWLSKSQKKAFHGLAR